MHCGKKTSRWRECNALGRDLLGNPGSGIHLDINLTQATYLNMVADQVQPFMMIVFPNGNGFFQQDTAPCHTLNRHGLRNMIRVLPWFEEHDQGVALV